MASSTNIVHRAPHITDDAGHPCVPSLINGRPIVQPASASFPVTSSKADKVIHYGQNATVEHAKLAVEASTSTFGTYRLTPAHERRRLLLRVAEIFENRMEEACYRMMTETSCTEILTRFNAIQTLAFLQEIAAEISGAITGELPPSFYGFTSLVFKEPVGPVLLIPTWNAALLASARGIATALAAGCTVVVKASELCPWTHQLVVEMFHEAGFPAGAINMIMAERTSGPLITDALIKHPHIRKIEFVGSAAVGKIIGSMAAENLKPILMELGDQSPVIVMDDADLEKAAHLCAIGTTAHQGQLCFSTERIIVQSTIKQDFIRLLRSALDRLPTGEVTVTQAAAIKAKRTIDAAVLDGATFLYGDNKMNGTVAVSPSILTTVNENSALSKMEAFAPTAFLVSVDTEAEAVAEANSRLGGLSASVFTGSYERGIRMARALEFGGVQINNMTLFVEPGGPVTGYKGSGWGSNNGRHGIEEFLYKKTVSLVPSDATLGF